MNSPLQYCQDYFSFQRHQTREILPGPFAIGGNNPIRIQSKLSTDATQPEACAQEILELTEKGCEILRVKIHHLEEAENLQIVRKLLLEKSCNSLLAADVVSSPEVTFEAMKWVDIIRVDPSNYPDDPEEVYASFQTLVYACKERGVALLISTHHESQTDSIKSRFGATPLGMCESAIEFATIAREADFHNMAFSMNSINPKIYIESYRLLVARLHQLGSDWNYPIHLASIESLDHQHQQIATSMAIGSLLADGIGDTIRAAISVDDQNKVKLGQAIIYSIQSSHLPKDPKGAQRGTLSYNPYKYSRRRSHEIEIHGCFIGSNHSICVVATKMQMEKLSRLADQSVHLAPDLILEDCPILSVDPYDTAAVVAINAMPESRLVTVVDGAYGAADIHAFRLLANKLSTHHPILLKDTLRPATDDSLDPLYSRIKAAVNIGSLLCDGIGDVILVQGDYDVERCFHLAESILHASGARSSETRYLTCPSCSHSQFDVQETTRKVQAATQHLKGVTIAVMGCVVNGPEELADADFAYIGGARGNITLYQKNNPVKFNIPMEDSIDALIDLIRADGKWIDPPAS